MKQETKPATSSTKVNWWVDLAVFVIFLVAAAPNFTGIALHEWFSVAMVGTILVHLLLHWAWLTATTRYFFTKATTQVRVNYVLNALLFIDFTLIIFSGLMISEAVLPFMGLEIVPNRAWSGLHHTSSELLIPLTGLHIALHWSWIVLMFKRYVWQPLTGRSAPTPARSIQEKVTL